DDQGRQFDAAGNLRDWWTADDADRFKTRAGLVVQQFDSYTVVDSATHVNGRLTLGEDIADLGGLKVAYAALQRALAGRPRPPDIDGLAPEQRFFLAWAQIWRSKATDQYLRNQGTVIEPVRVRSGVPLPSGGSDGAPRQPAGPDLVAPSGRGRRPGMRVAARGLDSIRAAPLRSVQRPVRQGVQLLLAGGAVRSE